MSAAGVYARFPALALRRGRDFAAWLGVVPRQYSTGGKQKLFGMSKRGNIYLRRMLIHGARAVLLRIKYDTGGRAVQRPGLSTSAVAGSGSLIAVKKTLRLESTERFPLSHGHDDGL